ncbi:EGF domain-specific O-linked N-acetylglucosamine transferase [Lasiodiplodia hormozganensis]|uniref:EGF domain-specific O-linked N-acetylglucosamine transferase n=1 Tax=Lasiodiplodia hormozganensis TaxID=869390 RepID=A0AA40CL02_9PEZI|nr:EGF domain-specific O-linked N-acetylglucosamine transferase [Lasiodiplodia hormozganensis]
MALAPLKTESFPKYLYNTGPYHIWSDYFSTVPGLPSQPFCSERQGTPKYTILVKRDGDGNMWHSLLEIFSLYLTLDTLRITPLDPSAHSPEPFLSAADMSSAQIVILDDYPDGPFFDLWKAIAPLPVVRLKDIPSYGTAAACLDNVIIPLAGGSNPLWRGDWHTGSCTHSQLIDTFTRRVLSHYGHGAANTSSSTSLLPPRPKDDTDTTTTPDLTLTFIDRRTSRALVDTEQHLANLRLHFPRVRVQAIDFAALPFAEQIRIIQTTDVLVGVHGAGLTHALFLPEGASVVEIQPRRLNYKGFRNLAKMRGHRYFSAHAAANDSAPDWHDLDVSVGEDEFLELVGAGIRAVLHRGGREEDVVVVG